MYLDWNVQWIKVFFFLIKLSKKKYSSTAYHAAIRDLLDLDSIMKLFNLFKNILKPKVDHTYDWHKHNYDHMTWKKTQMDGQVDYEEKPWNPTN